MGRSNNDPVARALALAAAAGQGGGGADAVIIEASANKTVNNYQVPQLTDEQLLQIYNAVVAGKPVTVTDATGSMHFSSLNADSVSGEVFVTMLYFDKMILEYSEGNQTTFTEIGVGGLTMDLLWENANPHSAFYSQAIQLQLENYDLFAIGFLPHANSYTDFQYVILSKKSSDINAGYATAAFVLYINDPLTTYSRDFKFELANSSIRFSTGSTWTANASRVGDHASCIPVKIYGIK